VGAGATYRHEIPACQSGNGRKNLTVFRYVGLDTVECDNAAGLDVSANRTQLLAAGVIDSKYVNDMTVSQIDTVSVGTTAMTTKVMELLMDSALLSVKLFNNSNLLLTSSAATDISAFLAKVDAVVNATLANMIDARDRESLDTSSISELYNAQIYALTNQSEAYRNSTQAAIDYLLSTAPVGSALVEALHNVSDQMGISRELLLSAFDAYFNAENILLGHLVDFSTSGRGLDFLSGLADFFEGVAEGTLDLAGDVLEFAVDNAKKLARALWSLIKGGMGKKIYL
jgi:hypothetical protein